MVRLIVLAFALALISTAQAKPLAPPQHPDDMVMTVGEGCGWVISALVDAACVTPSSALSGVARQGTVSPATVASGDRRHF
jgi:hypothetical protein